MTQWSDEHSAFVGEMILQNNGSVIANQNCLEETVYTIKNWVNNFIIRVSAGNKTPGINIKHVTTPDNIEKVCLKKRVRIAKQISTEAFASTSHFKCSTPIQNTDCIKAI